MSDEALLRIGEFSRASWLSVKALRTYHEMGLLVPADVDPDTGYRSYTVAQLTDATIIRRLRELDVPLDAIREVIDARDPDITRKVLTEHGQVLQQKLAAMQRAFEELSSAVIDPLAHTPVHRMHKPARSVLTVKGTIGSGELESFLDRTQVLLREAAETSGAVVDGTFGVAYPTLADDDSGQEGIAFLPVVEPTLLSPAARAAGVRVGEAPATDVAVFVHAGSYDTLDDAYRRLGAWVAANEEPSDLPVRELYVVSRADTDDPADLRTQICWPVKGRG
jgi:DNA-binding transcriptional MerR regulator